MMGLSENVFIDVKNKSHTINAVVDIPKNGANGVILAQAGRFGGWSLYLKDGKPTYTYNWLGLERYTVAATQAVPAGKATVRFEFAHDGGLGKGGTGTLFVNEKKAATGRIEKHNSLFFRRMKALTWARMKVRPSPRPIRRHSSSRARFTR
jgi:hypothetical protein